MARLSMDVVDHIDLVISSPGGDTDAGLMLTEFIDHELGKPVHARTWGKCNSSATFVLLCCKKRVAAPLTRFVIHRQTTSLELQYDATFPERLDAWKKEQALLLDRLTHFYATKLNISPEVAAELMERGSYGINDTLSTEEALRIGLVTEVQDMTSYRISSD